MSKKKVKTEKRTSSHNIFKFKMTEEKNKKYKSNQSIAATLRDRQIDFQMHTCYLVNYIS
jgi:hypothetical protein